MEALFRKHDRLLEVTPTKIIRQWMHSINWKARMMAIRGPKGVGKTTLMLQYIKLHYQPLDRQEAKPDLRPIAIGWVPRHPRCPYNRSQRNSSRQPTFLP